MRLKICVPSNRDHSPHFVASLVALVQHYTRYGIEPRPGAEIEIRIKTNCSNIATARMDLVDESIAGNFTHALFIDDDMTFPYNMLDKLCGYNSPVVAANCCQKRLPLTFTAIGLDRKRLDSRGKTGWEQVMRVGCAIMLIDLSIFANLPRPYFNFEWNSDSGKLISEDYYFCRLLNRSNVPIIIDHDVSQHIGHVGAYTYGLANKDMQ